VFSGVVTVTEGVIFSVVFAVELFVSVDVTAEAGVSVGVTAEAGVSVGVTVEAGVSVGVTVEAGVSAGVTAADEFAVFDVLLAHPAAKTTAVKIRSNAIAFKILLILIPPKFSS